VDDALYGLCNAHYASIFISFLDHRCYTIGELGKRRKTRSFQCEKERKPCTFFNPYGKVRVQYLVRST
jgi:hypothetical protein